MQDVRPDGGVTTIDDAKVYFGVYFDGYEGYEPVVNTAFFEAWVDDGLGPADQARADATPAVRENSSPVSSFS